MVLERAEQFFWHKLPSIASEHRITTAPAERGTPSGRKKAVFEDSMVLQASTRESYLDFADSLKKHGKVENAHWHPDKPMEVFARKSGSEIPESHVTGMAFFHGKDPTHVIMIGGKYGTTARRIIGQLKNGKLGRAMGRQNIHLTAKIIPVEAIELRGFNG